MNSKLKSLLATVFQVPVERMTTDASPENLPEWDSFAMVNLVVALEESYKCTFSMEEIVRLQCAHAIEELLHEKGLLS